MVTINNSMCMIANFVGKAPADFDEHTDLLVEEMFLRSTESVIGSPGQ